MYLFKKIASALLQSRQHDAYLPSLGAEKAAVWNEQTTGATCVCTVALNEEHVEDPGRMGRYNNQVGAGVRFWMWKRLRREAPTNNRGNARLHREESGEGLQRDLLDYSQSLFYFVILTDRQARKKSQAGWDKFLSVF